MTYMKKHLLQFMGAYLHKRKDGHPESGRHWKEIEITKSNETLCLKRDSPHGANTKYQDFFTVSFSAVTPPAVPNAPIPTGFIVAASGAPAASSSSVSKSPNPFMAPKLEEEKKEEENKESKKEDTVAAAVKVASKTSYKAMKSTVKTVGLGNKAAAGPAPKTKKPQSTKKKQQNKSSKTTLKEKEGEKKIKPMKKS